MDQCYEQVPDLPAVDTHPYRDAAIALAIILLFVALFDLWKLAHHGKTISHLLQHLTGGKFWRVLLGFGILAVLGWHLFIGFEAK